MTDFIGCSGILATSVSDGGSFVLSLPADRLEFLKASELSAVGYPAATLIVNNNDKYGVRVILGATSVTVFNESGTTLPAGASVRLQINYPAASVASDAHPGYFFHGFAPNQTAKDVLFRDISGFENHGKFGEHLALADAWATAEHVSTLAPSGGNNDGCIRFPSLNYDYAAGEKIIGFWEGHMTAPGAAASWIGDGASNLAGFRARVNTNGKVQIAVSDGTTQEFSIESTNAIADGAQHSFGWFVDGSARRYGMWHDEEATVAAFDALPSLGSGASRDTRNARSFNLGATAHKSFNSTDGIACATKTLVILRLAPETPAPALGVFSDLFRSLRANPARLIGKGDLHVGLS